MESNETSLQVFDGINRFNSGHHCDFPIHSNIGKIERCYHKLKIIGVMCWFSVATMYLAFEAGKKEATEKPKIVTVETSNGVKFNFPTELGLVNNGK